MLVVLLHTGDVVLNREDALGRSYILGWGHFDRFGAVGVDLFFVISGFVMALSVRKLAGWRGARDFLALRWVRIAPPYLIVSACVFAQNAASTGTPTWRSVANAVLLVPIVDGETYTLPPLTAGWTLSFEFTFYLLVAVMVWAGWSKRLHVLAGAFVVTAAIGVAVSPEPLILNWVTNPIFLEFSLGLLAYLLWSRGIHTKARPLWLAGSAFAALALAGEIFMGFHGIDNYILVLDGSHSLARVGMWGVPCFLVFMAYLPSSQPSSTSSGGRLLRTLGNASFSIYLVHKSLFFLVDKVIDRLPVDPPADLVVVGCLVLAAAVGYAYWRLVEAPVTEYLRRRVSRELHTPPHLDPAT